MKFRRNAQVHVYIQRIVMGDKRFGRCTARLAVQHRRFHLNVTQVVQILADGFDDARPRYKRLLYLWIDNQVHIPLAVAEFRITEPVPLFGQRR